MLVSKPSDCVRLELIGGYSDLVLPSSQDASEARDEERDKKKGSGLNYTPYSMSVLLLDAKLIDG